MKLNTLCMAGAAALVLASCSGASDSTLLKGTVENKEIASVQIAVNADDISIDTTLAVTDGKFSIELPVSGMNYGMLIAGNERLPFILDGTVLEAVIAETSTIVSDSKTSVHNAFVAYQDHAAALDGEIRAEYDRINADTTLTDALKQEAFSSYYESKQDEFVEYNKGIIAQNNDNFLGLNALSNVYYEFQPEELKTVVESLSDEAKAHPFVKGLIESLDAKLATAEGKMFTDFEVQTVVGHDRSVDANPIYATAKLSDYVGKGKYVLVDFWSPWCGPCKREMPNIKAIYEKWHGEHFDVLSIAVWEREDVKVTIETADKLGVTWNQINNAKDIPTKLYGIDGIPHIILFGPDGTILKRGLHGEELAKTVDEYLSEK